LAQLFGVVVSAALGLLFIKTGLEGIREFRERENAEREHGAARVLGTIYIAIGVAGLFLATFVALTLN
jgi:hypothetical protein